MLKSPIIYVLLFGSNEEMIVSKAIVKFSTLIFTMLLYTNPTVIMPLGVFKSAKIVSIPPPMKNAGFLFAGMLFLI